MTKGLLLAVFDSANAQQDEFNDWHDHEHIPLLSKVPGTLCARRFRDPNGTHRYLALYHLASPEVPTTDAWKQATGTPWTERLRPHFRDHLRILPRRYVRDARRDASRGRCICSACETNPAGPTAANLTRFPCTQPTRRCAMARPGGWRSQPILAPETHTA